MGHENRTFGHTEDGMKAGTNRLRVAGIVVGIVVATLIVASIAVYLVMDIEKKDLNDETRAELGGSYVRLSDGLVHYRLEGQSGNPVLVLLHGGTIPMFTWNLHVSALAGEGFRVLVYDMYGRGFSDRPERVYSRELYVQQLLDLLDALDVDEAADLVGLSFGGAIAAAFTAQHPERVKDLVLISPVIKDYATPALFQVPLLGPFAARVIGRNKVATRAEGLLAGTELQEEGSTLFQQQMEYRGFQRALVSMLKSDALGDYTEEYKIVGKQDRKMMIIWGSEDDEITLPLITLLRELLPSAEFHTLQGVGHGVVFHKPQEVEELLLGFFE
jgi:pimeloyl-ACP methyl ester carboxylesterase